MLENWHKLKCQTTLWVRRRLERLPVSASGRARGTRNSSKRFLRHKVNDKIPIKITLQPLELNIPLRKVNSSWREFPLQKWLTAI